VGKVEPGRCVDFVALGLRIGVIPPEQIADAHILVTVIEGRIVQHAAVSCCIDEVSAFRCKGPTTGPAPWIPGFAGMVAACQGLCTGPFAFALSPFASLPRPRPRNRVRARVHL